MGDLRTRLLLDVKYVNFKIKNVSLCRSQSKTKFLQVAEVIFPVLFTYFLFSFRCYRISEENAATKKRVAGVICGEITKEVLSLEYTRIAEEIVR